MRIGISTSVIQRGRTGIAQHLFSLLDAFARSDVSHSFSLFVFEQDLALFHRWNERFQLVPVPEAYRPPVRNILWHQTALPKLAKQHKIDLLHLPSYRRLVWAAPCPTVATIHDLAPFRIRAKYDPVRMIYGRIVVKALARRQNHIIAVSRNTARDLQLFFQIPEDRISVIHNGIDHSRFTPDRSSGVPPGLDGQGRLNKPFLLYVARLEHPGKNHLRLISAFERFKSISRSKLRLILAGSDWHGAEKIHNAIRKSEFRSDIQTFGFVSNQALPDLYRSAHAFVYPSLYEGFGLPPVEAMACGCPVMTSTRGALDEVVSGAALTVDPEDVDSLTQGLLEITSDEGLRSRLIRAGFARAQCFTWDKAAAETLGVYSKSRLSK